MKIYENLALLFCSTLILSGCNNNSNEDAATPDPDTTDDISDSSEKWTDEQKALLNEYAGSVIPYPDSFTGEVNFEEIIDEETSIKYLQISTEATEFTIQDYYKNLETSGWDVIKSYNDKVAQTSSSGVEFYEAVHTSTDNEVGYDLKYYFFSSGDEESDSKYNVIQCANYFDGKEDTKTSWDNDEQNVFKETITEVAPLLKLGKKNAVTKYSNDIAYLYDELAIDNTIKNVRILRNSGYTLDEGLSESKDAYVLYKKLEGGQTIYVSLYYSRGNNIIFSYQVEIQTSETWPSEVTSAFKNETGFELPTFSANVYFYYTNKGVTTIYTYSSDYYSLLVDYQMTMEKIAVFDSNKSWYTDWEETFFVKPMINYSSDLGGMFGVSFGSLDEPYDNIVEGYPTDEVATFMDHNNITGTLPTFDFTSCSKYSATRVEVKNYEDAYEEIEAKVMQNPSWYVDDYTNEEAVKNYIAAQAKTNTAIKIKIYDEYNDTISGYKVSNYIIETLANAGWCRLNSWMYAACFENASGSVLVGVSEYLNIVTLTITYGSGEEHTPRFEFETTNVTLGAGKSYNLDLVVDMLPYDYTYTSSNPSVVSVDQSGCVSVSSDAKGGEQATITATMNVPGESTPRVATCIVTVSDTYTAEKAINKVADLYNNYFNLSSSDAGAAVPQTRDVDGYISYNFTVETTFESEEDAETFVSNNLILAGFKTYYDWDETTYDDTGDIVNKYLNYSYNSDDWETFITLTYRIYTDATTGKVMLKVICC